MIKQELYNALTHIQELTPMQNQAIEAISTGADTVLLAPTGSGKTLAFLLPLLSKINYIKQSQVLILAPTSELIIQTLDQVRLLIKNSQLPITCTSLVGNPSRIVETLKKQKPHILVGSPDRALDFISSKRLKATTLTALVIDEADYFFNNEHKATVEKIISALPTTAQIILSSATLTTADFKFLKDPQVVSQDAAINSNIVHNFVIAAEYRKKYDVLRSVLNKESPEATLVFINNSHEAKLVYDRLLHHGFKASILTGNQDKQDRASALSKFRAHKTNVLVSSDLSARGLDIPSISYVINLDLPPNSNAYVHRAGRSSRFGNHGVSLCIVTKGETDTIADYEKDLSIKFTPFKN